MSYASRKAVALGFSAALVLSACQTTAQPPNFSGPFETVGKLERPLGPFQLNEVQTVAIPMRDGVRLATDVYLPLGKEVTETVLIRTPYNKAAFAPAVSQTGTVATFVEHGYAVLVQDTRGRHGSEGEFAPTYKDDTDSYDTMDWIISQPWSNGVIGTHGCSYLGEIQIAAAGLRHPAWKAAIPMASGGANGGVNGRDRQFALWNGGVFELAMGLSWFNQYGGTNGLDGPAAPAVEYSTDPEMAQSSLPVVAALGRLTDRDTQFDEYVTNRPGSAYWDEFPFLTGDETVGVPALFIESWYDYGPEETFSQLAYFQANSGKFGDSHRVVMDPATHCAQHQLTDNTIVGERPVGDARFEFFELYLAWFAYWLRGEENGVNNMPLVTYYRMGDGQWLTSDSWPVSGTKFTPFYLRESNEDFGGLALTSATEDRSLTYTYDPANPLPTLGAPVCCTTAQDGESLEGAFDQSANASRPDVLVFETPILDTDVDVTGPVTATLFVSSDAKDTDFTVTLMDVYPDGRAFNVVDGIQRMRWRNGFDEPEFMNAGEVYEVTIDLQATSNLFLKGHRIRVEVSSSSFPRFTRNLNTGEDNHLTTDMQLAQNTVFVGGDKASFITLPIVERPKERDEP